VLSRRARDAPIVTVVTLDRVDVTAVREALAQYNWEGAHELAAAARIEDPPDVEALEALAEAAWWTSHIDECIAVREHCYRLHEEAGDLVRAGAVAMELSENFDFRGQASIARAWLARARRLLAEAPDDATKGRLYLREAEVAHSTGDVATAIEFGERALALGRSLRELGLEAESLQCLARLHIADSRATEGLALFDEAMLLATEDRCNPFVTGKVYCSFISACEQLGDLHRAAEWIGIACDWADQHPVSAFPGLCRVHRAEVLQMRGDWERAEEEARRACAELDGVNAYNTALSLREIGDIRRRIGDLAGAAQAFREASHLGVDPQPGLALLRLAEGKVAVAARMIQQARCEVGDNDLALAKLLPAAVQIGVAADDIDAARGAADDLDRIARVYGTSILEATAAASRGRLLLADSDITGAITSLRLALQRWRALAVPYEVASTLVLLGESARRAGDEEEATAYFTEACTTFEHLGAVLDLARATTATRDDAGILTTRETDLLRLVAAGHTNREIAGELFLSEKTVERHLSNVFRKLGVSSRAAATAQAVRLGLVDVPA
jgi:ATP/maltotriose-dependent transcriptional regulator MalT